MSSKGLVAILLALGFLNPVPLAVYAQEEAPIPEVPEVVETPEVPETDPEPVIEETEPDTEISATPEVELIEVADPPEEALMAAFSDEEEFVEEEEPELIWGCEMTMDNEGNEYEQCGMGYYRTLCGYNAGVEECITFFQFYEEEPDYLQMELDELFEYNVLNLSLTWNGNPLSGESSEIPTGTGTLGWSYVIPSGEVLEDLHNRFFRAEQAETALSHITFKLQVYKGTYGSSTLVYTEDLGHTLSGETVLNLSGTDPYQIVILGVTENALEPLNLCMFASGGELCPYLDPRAEAFEWFMYNGATCNSNDFEPPEFCYDRDHPDYKPDGRIHPFAFGTHQLTIGEAPAISSVLFLPGIKGSRLYKPSDTCDPDLSLSCPSVKLWEPSGNVLLRELFLTSAGDSGRRDIYTKEEDIVSEVLGANFYASFVNQMEALTADGTIPEWKAVAYDWRLSLDDVLSMGTVRGDKIFYREESETPYIEETLRELAAGSPTGKVSIVAHSNGGLVTKKLMQQLEAQGDEDLVDKIIFVGVPQSGAPQAIGALLFGYGEALPRDECSQFRTFGWVCSIFGSRDMARSLAEHSPMAYHLLPSAAYFEQVQDSEHPVALFTASTMYAEERGRYGNSIDSAQELFDFLEAKDGGRTKPTASDIGSPNVLNSNLLSYGMNAHTSLDSWTPPSGIQVYQIAGWGVPTVAGIEFYEQRKLLGGYKEMYRPLFVEDGDGVVPVPSALMLAEGSNVRNFWLDLDSVATSGSDIDHGNIFELNELRVLLRDLLINEPDSRPEYVSESQPPQRNGDKLVFYLHSPLTLELYDSDGNHVGETEDGEMNEEIEGVTYGEFGEVKYIIAPAGEYIVSMRGKASGTFSLDIQSLSGNEIVSSVTLADVPTTEATVATIAVNSDLANTGALMLDLNGDGTAESEIQPSLDDTVLYTEIEVSPTETDTSSSKRSSTSRSTSITTDTPSLITNAPVPAPVAAPVAQRPPTQQLAQVLVPQGNPDPVLIAANHASSPTEPVERRALTASAYDAIDTDVLKQIGEVLYNLWKGIANILSRIFVWE